MTSPPSADRRRALPIRAPVPMGPPGVGGLDLDQLAAIVADLDEPAYRVRQVADAAWRSPAASWDEVTTLARPLRAALAERSRFDTLAETSIRPADGGATEKALHRLADGRLVESVLMRYPGASGPTRAGDPVPEQPGRLRGRLPFLRHG